MGRARTLRKHPQLLKIVRRTRKRAPVIPATGARGQCQCLKYCRNPALPGEAFCKHHLRQCPLGSPLTHWEPKYRPDIWNNNEYIKLSHNCFAYAMNTIEKKQVERCKKDKYCDTPFHQPGLSAKYGPFYVDVPKTCPGLVVRILGDNPDITRTTFEKKCPAKTSKVALVIDEDEDYHFLRQDSNGFWSQKSGGRAVTNKDASGHKIWNPQLSYMNYKDGKNTLNYDIFCSYLCVPRDKSLNLKVGGGSGVPDL